MGNEFRVRAGTALTFFAVLSLISPEALSCSPSRKWVMPPVGVRAILADYVIEGVAPLAKKGDQTATVTVYQWLKGSGSRQVVITGFGWGPDCRAPVPEGAAIFFATDEGKDGQLELRYAGPWSAVTKATPNVISDVQQALRLGFRDYMRGKIDEIAVVAVATVQGGGAKRAYLRLPDGRTENVEVGDPLPDLGGKVLSISESQLEVEFPALITDPEKDTYRFVLKGEPGS